MTWNTWATFCLLLLLLLLLLGGGGTPWLGPPFWIRNSSAAPDGLGRFKLWFEIFPQTGVFSTGRGSYSSLKQWAPVCRLLPWCPEILPQLPPIVFPFRLPQVASQDFAPVASQDFAPVASQDFAPVASQDLVPVVSQDSMTKWPMTKWPNDQMTNDQMTKWPNL